MRINASVWLLVLGAIALNYAVADSRAMAAPVYGAPILVAADGDVIATFASTFAGFNNDLYLDSPANALGVIFSNQTTPVDTMVNLGSFTAGTELIFRLHVNDNGDNFFSGPASRNSDSVIHAAVDDEVIPNASYVGFEDQNGGGDFNYFNLNFYVSNTRAGEVPEPATALLGGWGIVLMAVPRRLRSRLPEKPI